MGCLVKIIIFILGIIGLAFGIVRGVADDNDILVVALVVVSFLWLGGGFVLLSFLAKRDTNAQNKALEAIPLSTDTVTVVSKLHEQNIGGVTVTESTNSYFIVFEFSNNRREKFAVNAKDYALVREEDTGILSYKRVPESKLLNESLLFVDFQADKISSKKEDWTCVYCRAVNEATTFTCHSCKAPKKKV